jgi:hypothetical protein
VHKYWCVVLSVTSLLRLGVWGSRPDISSIGTVTADVNGVGGHLLDIIAEIKWGSTKLCLTYSLCSCNIFYTKVMTTMSDLIFLDKVLRRIWCLMWHEEGVVYYLHTEVFSWTSVITTLLWNDTSIIVGEELWLQDWYDIGLVRPLIIWEGAHDWCSTSALHFEIFVKCPLVCVNMFRYFFLTYCIYWNSTVPCKPLLAHHNLSYHSHQGAAVCIETFTPASVAVSIGPGPDGDSIGPGSRNWGCSGMTVVGYKYIPLFSFHEGGGAGPHWTPPLDPPLRVCIFELLIKSDHYKTTKLTKGQSKAVLLVIVYSAYMEAWLCILRDNTVSLLSGIVSYRCTFDAYFR